AITLAASHDVDAFVERELRDRAELSYPPYSRLALVRIEAIDELSTQREAERLARIARRSAPDGVLVVGPAPAPIARLRNRFRWRFMLRSRERGPLRETLLAVARS